MLPRRSTDQQVVADMDIAAIRYLPSWRAALTQAQHDGWNIIATGDWSWVHESPNGAKAWRITPFDPAFDAFAKVCLTTDHPHLPRIEATQQHPGGGSSVIMERLDRISERTARAWLEDFANATKGPLASLRQLLHDRADQSTIPLFVGIDANPANVLVRPSDGVVVFTDAYWINGPHLMTLMRTEPSEALDAYPADVLKNWAHLPCMDEETTAMILRQIDGTLAASEET